MRLSLIPRAAPIKGSHHPSSNFIMKLVINGETRQLELPANPCISDVLEAAGYGGLPVLVECNGEALFRTEFETTPVAEADELEFVRMVAGG